MKIIFVIAVNEIETSISENSQKTDSFDGIKKSFADEIEKVENTLPIFISEIDLENLKTYCLDKRKF